MTLPEGMKKNQRLPEALLTPSTKAEKGEHDESVSREQIIAMGALSAARLRRGRRDVRARSSRSASRRRFAAA